MGPAPLEPWLDRRFIAHSYACRPGKGAHRAVDYYQRQARRYPYVLKVDGACGQLTILSHSAR